MTDRELLEMAAKAAGIDGEWNGDFGKSGMIILRNPRTYRLGFDPINDDGDALRLAVKLNLLINIVGMFAHADCCNRDDDIGYFEENSARNDGCILKATRRAIVRAAAAIGELMP